MDKTRFSDIGAGSSYNQIIARFWKQEHLPHLPASFMAFYMSISNVKSLMPRGSFETDMGPLEILKQAKSPLVE